jgi:hypothetical protein
MFTEQPNIPKHKKNQQQYKNGTSLYRRSYHFTNVLTILPDIIHYITHSRYIILSAILPSTLKRTSTCHIIKEISNYTVGSFKMEDGFIPNTITIYYFLA